MLVLILLYHIILANGLFDSWLEKVDTMHFLLFDLQVMLVQRVNIIDRTYLYCPQVFFFKLLKTCFYIKLWFENFLKNTCGQCCLFFHSSDQHDLQVKKERKCKLTAKYNILLIMILFQHQVEIIIVIQAKPTGKIKELF